MKTHKIGDILTNKKGHSRRILDVKHDYGRHGNKVGYLYIDDDLGIMGVCGHNTMYKWLNQNGY